MTEKEMELFDHFAELAMSAYIRDEACAEMSASDIAIISYNISLEMIRRRRKIIKRSTLND